MTQDMLKGIIYRAIIQGRTSTIFSILNVSPYNISKVETSLIQMT